MDLYFNDKSKIVFNENFIYKLSPLGFVVKLTNNSMDIEVDDVRCSCDDVISKLEEYYIPFIDNLIEKAESELVKLQKAKFKTLLKLKKGDLDGN